MASEKERGCGFRKVGGLYLVGEYISVPCDRLPMELTSCPICGAGIHTHRDSKGKIQLNRGISIINPLKLFGKHLNCADKIRPCKVCDPLDDIAYIMTVGKRNYTPQSFLQEAIEDGVSKRIPFIPRGLKLGKTIIYLAHPEAYNGVKKTTEQEELFNDKQARLLDADKVVKKPGIFCAFIPQRVEMPIYKSKLTKKKKAELKKRGITPVVIKDGDKDHK